MPLYQFALRLASDMPGQAPRKWSNTFQVNAASAIAAAAVGTGLWIGYLSNAARNRVFCYEVYAHDMTPGTDDFATLAVPASDQRGGLSTASIGDPYYPKVCLAMTISVTGSRPSRKFWRPGLGENDVTAGVSVDESLVTAFASQIDGFITGNPGLLVDVDNEPWLGFQKATLTDREFGRESQTDVPVGPPLG